MKNKKLTIVLGLITITCLATVFVLVSGKLPGNDHKVAYIRSSYLIENYIGMKQAREIFQERQVLLSIKLDSLKADYRQKEQQLINNINTVSEKEREDLQLSAETARRDLQAKANELEQLLNEEDGQMTQGVLNQVNSFVEEYGKKNGYDLIFGTTSSGSILYGNNYLDISEEVLKALNEQYMVKK